MTRSTTSVDILFHPGKTDIYDRKSLNKIACIDAPNTSHFEWAPSGDIILTAILSPRLRVDNGVKIWYVDGTLLHVMEKEELYQVNWRPHASTPPFPLQIPPAPKPSPVGLAAFKPVVAKPAGAYRPPGALGRAAPSIFSKREDEGVTVTPIGGGGGGGGGGRGGYTNGNNNNHTNGYGHANGFEGRGRGRMGPGRYVPGAPPPREGQGDGGPGHRQGQGYNQGQGGGQGQNQDKKKKARDKKKGASTSNAVVVDGNTPEGGQPAANNHVEPTAPATLTIPDLDLGGDDLLSAGGDSGLDPVQKKIRNLNKKVCTSLSLSLLMHSLISSHSSKLSMS